MDDYRKIGIWQTAFLGDAVLTLPMIRALKDRYPDAELHLFVRKGVESVFQAQPELASVRPFDKRGEAKSLGDAWKYGRGIAAEGFDLWISAHKSMRSALVSRATSIARRIGYNSPWFNRLAYSETVDRRFDELEEVERLLQLLKPLGIEGPAPETGLVLPESAHVEAGRLWGELAGNRPVLGVHPGSTWPTKCWIPEYFSEVITRAADAGATVFVFAGPGEEALAREIMNKATPQDPERVVSLANRLNLPNLAACLNRLDAYLTNDSGPMHLAWMQETPLVALFGPTVRELGFFPRGENATVLETELECRPCGLHGPRKCPEEHHRCMRDITPEVVWETLRKKIGI